ncbi:Aste57867_11162 [Aphanomyces stellatus]|uniref:Aste57867_11162 protein n=1 Tax=Aphanomyces stellatus TaxID=120398 RepID=A0A485KSM0_9STRA|nr:hypothetical protein As57867_011120 [Aphanomyces stellatus]VFT88029.1 Aste57867_11162 [Aphanomyces stellatus]
MPPRVLILPGNGCTPIEECNWYAWLAEELRARGVEVVLRDMPDPLGARESIWLPFVRDVMKCDENTVVVGHSSGAEAAMRLAETTTLLGMVLVAACVTDLGDEGERASGYYNRPWEYEKMKANVSWIVQFGAPDDRFIPAAEQQQVAAGLGSEFHFLRGKDHYMTEEEPLILEAIVEKLHFIYIFNQSKLTCSAFPSDANNDTMLRFLIVPGSNVPSVEKKYWYAWLATELRTRGFEVVLNDMPDPYVARESMWLPFIRDVMKCDEDTIFIGHSSGAQAAMRLAESTKLRGMVLVSACVTDLDMEHERASGYYDRPWEYEKIKANVSWVIQFGSPDDPFLPATEQNQVAAALDSEYHFLPGTEELGYGHYMTPRVPFILDAILKKINSEP